MSEQAHAGSNHKGMGLVPAPVNLGEKSPCWSVMESLKGLRVARISD